MQQFIVSTTRHNEIFDITDQVNQLLNRTDNQKGICHLFVLHTTCCLTTADLDPGTDEDLLEAIKKMLPKGNWHHPHDAAHVGEHIMSSIIGQSIGLPVENGKLVLGTWQRVVFIDLSGPRERSLLMQFLESD